jgi:putative ABC transport system permease protein
VIRSPLVPRVVAGAARWVMRLAPAAQQSMWRDDGEETLMEVCRDARATRGWWGLAHTAFAEIADIARASVKARAGIPTPITGGHTPNVPPHKGRPLMQTLSHDIRLAVRSLLASRVQSTIAILTLALGIGANTAIFSVIDSLLIRPVPFDNAGRLVELWNFAEKSKVSFRGFKRELMKEWQGQTDLFDRIEAYDVESAIFQGPAGARTVAAAFVSPGLLSLLGVAPIEGRLFVPGDGREGTDAQVVISQRFWREALGSISAVTKTTIVLNGRPHSIIGVLPSSFHFPNQAQEVWLPLDVHDPPSGRAAGAEVIPFARLQPGVPLDQATGRVQERGSRLARAAGGDEGITATLHSRTQIGDARTRQSLIVIGGAVGFLLLIVCANIANLSLSRTLARSRDFAIRSALGARRRDLIRETIVENLVIGAVGSTAGLAVAWVALALTTTFIPEEMVFQSMNQIDLDGRVLGFAVAAGLLTSLLFGLPPAIIGSRSNVLGILRQESRSSAGSVVSRRLRSSLVVGEVTIAIVLLVGAALMARSFLKLQSVDRGFDSNGLVALKVGFPTGPYTDQAIRDRLVEAALAELRRLPGVQGATAGSVPPETDMIAFTQIEFLDRPGQLSEELVVPVYKVWPDYFATIGLTIVEGRAFSADEPSDSTIVSQSFAKKFWPGGTPVGRQFRYAESSRLFTVVGVSTEVRQLGMDDAEGSFEWFQPMKLAPGASARPRPNPPAIIEYRTFLVRADNAAAVVPALSEAIHQIDNRLVVWETNVVNDLFSEAVARPKLVLVLLLVFAGMGLVLAAAGIYGVLSYLVTQRLREIGIRLALGASPEGVFNLVLRNGLSLTMTGLAIGLVASYFLVRVMRTILFEVEPSDPIAVAGVSVLLLLAALLACWRPARRAMKVDPVNLLREQ